ncbi:hypothetical protein BJX63DRAFT_402298 [Aspergillus granulosus]|uniref:Alcohol acetyltransferase n=1 Tax=Aspergillus granulosus TaxID=176169 RepID=A0ABR4H4H2_9EURO
MSLTPLDLSVGRFLEFSFTLVYQEVYAEEDLQHAARALLAKYPVLGARMNFLRAKLRPRDSMNILQSRHISKALADIVDIASLTRVDSNAKELDKLFTFANGLRQSLQQSVVLIRAVFLKDATVIRFITQHPLCDASGAYAIATAYTSILNGSEPPEISFDRPVPKLKDSFTRATPPPHSPTPQERPSVLDRTRPLFRWNLRELNKNHMKLVLRDLLHPSHRRVDNTVYVPEEKIRAWRENAREHGLDVTEHDLLSAFIYQASYEPHAKQAFTLLLSIRRELEDETPMHNSCLVIPIDVASASAHTQSKETSASPTLPRIAAEVRRTILESRKPDMLPQLFEHYSKPRKYPMVPRLYGTKASQSIVTSWTHLQFFELGIHETKPTFVTGSVDMCKVYKKLGAEIEDCAITWRSRPTNIGEGSGYLIRGRLHREAWRKMEEVLDGKEV